MMRLSKALVIGLLTLLSTKVYARKFSLGTDILGYVRLVTLNLEASYALDRYWSLTAGVRYNPFTFNEGNSQRQFQMRQQSYSLGVRLWPWHAWSGWWMACKIRYQEYNQGGIVSPKTEEGNRYGAGIYAGYTYMLNSHLNLEMGLGLWTGISRYRVYSCPVCGLNSEIGRKIFLLPDDISISLVYVF